MPLPWRIAIPKAYWLSLDVPNQQRYDFWIGNDGWWEISLADRAAQLAKVKADTEQV